MASKRPPADALSKRERQIMNILYRRGQATVAEVLADLPNPPTYSACRASLRILEEKGHVAHEEDSVRYVYKPLTSPVTAGRTAFSELLNTFFQGSVERALSTLLDSKEKSLSEEELDRLTQLIEKARREKANG